MPFTTAERARFIELLQTRGWQFHDGTIWSPSRGLWFSDSHLSDWSPSEMHGIFTRRSARIAKAQIGDWQISSRENQEASWAAEEVRSST
jgi:hypothetical protein